MKRGVVFSAWGEVSWEKTDYEYEYEHEQEHDEGEEEEGQKGTPNVEASFTLSVIGSQLSGSRGSSGKKSSPREAEPFRRAKLF